ncbi:MAG: hypothetical protein HQL01_01405 [Nitrospirae bacterium]|nr:hypothetical protein [Nitrospirota bacterium]
MKIKVILHSFIILLTIFGCIAYAGDNQTFDYTHVPETYGQNQTVDWTRVPETYMAYEKTEGPYSVNDKSFTLFFKMVSFFKMVKRTVPTDLFDENVEYLGIRDERGKVHYTEPNPIDILNPLYISISAYTLEGEKRQGLVLTYGEMPSGPGYGFAVKLFTTNNGRLVELSGKLNLIGGIHDSMQEGTNKNSMRLLDNDTLNYKLHVNHFTMIIPLKVPLNTSGRVMPIKWEGIFEIETEGHPIYEESCVKLYTNHSTDSPSKALIVGPQTKVQFIHAYTRIGYEAFYLYRVNSKGHAVFPMDISISDTWLKVKIDDREGWITGEKHFEAVGLPFSG